MPTAPPTRAEWVDAQLRRAILRGELAPGERLYAERLADELGVSPTPLRETFQRLAGEGLVVIEPQRGARVASLSIDEAVEIYELRLLLDPVALRRSIQAADHDPEFVAEVERAHEAMGAARSPVGYHEAHRAFHLTLISRCPNQRLRTEVAQLLDHAQRFHVVAKMVRRDDPAGEHAALVDAVRDGDGREAASILRMHLLATLDAVRAAEGA